MNGRTINDLSLTILAYWSRLKTGLTKQGYCHCSCCLYVRVTCQHHSLETRHQPVVVPILGLVSWTEKVNFPSACLRLKAWGFEIGLVIWCFPRWRFHQNRNAPSSLSSVHTIVYRWRSLQRLRQHKASRPRGSSINEHHLFMLFRGYHAPELEVNRALL